MNSFSEAFERYTPGAWFSCGITRRDDDWEKPVRKPQMQHRRVPIFITAAIIAVSSVSPAVATTVNNPFDRAISSQHECAEQTASEPVVPPMYWPTLIASLKTAPAINEEDFEDFESLY